MKGSKDFKEVISAHLNKLAAADPLFAVTLTKPKKNIDDCVTYILNEVKRQNVQGMSDDEVYGLAVHYYDEDDIKPGKTIKNVQVVLNQSIKAAELTPDEIQAAKQKAQDMVIEEERSRMQKKAEKKKRADLPESQTSLF